MTTQQEVSLGELIEITQKSIEAIKADITNSVFNVEFHSSYPYEEEKKTQAVGSALMTLEQNQEKLRTVEAMLEKYNLLFQAGADKFLLEKE